MKRLYFLFLLCLVASSLLADSVSVERAQAVAQQFLRTGTCNPKRSVPMAISVGWGRWTDPERL